MSMWSCFDKTRARPTWISDALSVTVLWFQSNIQRTLYEIEITVCCVFCVVAFLIVCNVLWIDKMKSTWAQSQITQIIFYCSSLNLFFFFKFYMNLFVLIVSQVVVCIDFRKLQTTYYCFGNCCDNQKNAIELVMQMKTALFFVAQQLR